VLQSEAQEEVTSLEALASQAQTEAANANANSIVVVPPH
jgi:hypothetical protein